VRALWDCRDRQHGLLVIRDMPPNASNVCLSRKTGSDARALKTALLTRNGPPSRRTSSGSRIGPLVADCAGAYAQAEFMVPVELRSRQSARNIGSLINFSGN
jgi:hypothetical protein